MAAIQEQEFKTKTKVPNISLMNNITFLPEGVIFRKAYEIGNGYLMPNNLFKDNVTIRGFEVHMIRYYIGVVNLYFCLPWGAVSNHVSGGPQGGHPDLLKFIYCCISSKLLRSPSLNYIYAMRSCIHPCKWGSSGATDVLGVSIGEFNKMEDMEWYIVM